MDSLWLHKTGQPNLIIFCNGWGMDDRPFRPLLPGNCDVLMLCDYRRLTPLPDVFELSSNYEHMYLISWSMGVWVGQRLFCSLRKSFSATVAINGTLCPIHDDLGIPAGILTGTVRNYSQESRLKLYRRMCRDREHSVLFQANLPDRSLESQKEELEILRGMCDCQPVRQSMYSHIMIADRDLVMPTGNQLQFWQAHSSCTFHGHHFPFYLWPSWQGLLAAALH